jgi:hypothetical protein
MNSAINSWGPALLVCFTVLIGILTNNKRIDDLRTGLTGQSTALRSDLTGQIAALRSELTARIDGLEKRLVDRLERLEHPVARP